MVDDSARSEPEHLVAGTGCVGGHLPGMELDAGRIGLVPTARKTWIGVGLIAWVLGGALLLGRPQWASLGAQVAVLWLGLAALVVRNLGHRGKCWRTRTWRHAWGGLVPTGSDPTRPAGDDD